MKNSISPQFSAAHNSFIGKNQFTVSRIKLIALAICLCTCFMTTAQTKTWTGAYNSSWIMPFNWTPSGIPSPFQNVVIASSDNDPILEFSSIIKSLTIEEGVSLTIESTGTLVIRESDQNGILNDGTLENFGIIEIGDIIPVGQHGIRNNKTIRNDGGIINIYNTTDDGIYNVKTITNKNNGTITIGGIGNEIEGNGLLLINTAKFHNDGAILKIDNTAESAIIGWGDYNNINQAELHIGRNGGNIVGWGFSIGNTSKVKNDNSLIKIDDVQEKGILIEHIARYDNINGGITVIGENGNLGDFAIHVDDDASFINGDCSYLNVASNNIIKSQGNIFTNDGVITENATGTSNIKINNGVIQNLNGGTFNVNTNNGSVTTWTGIVWTNCGDQDFSNAENWINGQTPTTSDRLIILPPFGAAGTEPKVLGFDVGYAKSIRIAINAKLQLNSFSKLVIENSPTDGIYNQGAIINHGELEIGLNSTIGQDGIDNRGTFDNQGLGIIRVDNTNANGIRHQNGTFTNNGNIIIGNNDIGTNGIYNNNTFNNNGFINIYNTQSHGMYCNASTFTNNHNLRIGENGDILGDGLYINNGTFNNSSGLLNIYKTTGLFGGAGIRNFGTFSNSSTITLGNTNPGIGGTGVHNEGNFNHLSGTFIIEVAGLDGIHNTNAGTFTNWSTISIGGGGYIGRHGILNGATFTNEAGGDIDVYSPQNLGLDNYAPGIFTSRGNSSLYLEKKALNEAGTIINEENSNFYCLQDIDNDGGTFSNKDNALTESEEKIINQNSGVFSNEGSLASVNSGKDIINDGSTMTNDADIYSDEGIQNLNGAILQGNGVFNIKEEWLNNATFNAGSSKVKVIGDVAASIGGSSLTTFYNLQIQKSGDPVALNNAIQINNNLSFSTGKLNLNDNDLTLGNSNGKILGEFGFNYIYSTNGGEIIKTVDLNSPTNENPGNIGVNITSSANLGTTTIKRGHVIQDVNGETSIDRYYDISPFNNSGLDATVQFSYLDYELNGISEGDLAPFRYNGVDWDEYPTTNYDDIANWVETTNVNSFSTWTLAQLLAPLPVELMSFKVRSVDNEKVLLEWQTASEENNDFFEIQRSRDDLHFETIEIVEGAGNSNVIQTYQSWDEKPYSGKNYYRLKQTDFDGAFDYSDIKVVEIKNSGSQISVFPNPTSGNLNFNESLSGDLMVKNVLGQTVWQMSDDDLQSLDLSHLSAGSYLLLYLDEQDNLQTAKFIISKN